MIRILIALALLAGLAMAVPATAIAQKTPNLADVVFDEIERRVIRDFFGVKTQNSKKGAKGKGGKKSGGLPPGLAKRDRLPPGLQNQIQRNGRLPPGLAKRALPSDLEGRLRKRKGYDRLIVGDDVVLVQRATGLIMDVLKGVLTN